MRNGLGRPSTAKRVVAAASHLFGKGANRDMCARPGKILSSPKMIRIIHSASTLSVESRKRSRYRLKIAIRNAVVDMKEILEGGDPKSAAFLRSELKKLPGFVHEKNEATRPKEPEDGSPAATAPSQRNIVRSGQPDGPEDGCSEAPSEADAGMDVEDSLWG